MSKTTSISVHQALIALVQRQGGVKLSSAIKELGRSIEIKRADILKEDADQTVELHPELVGSIDFMAYQLPSTGDAQQPVRFFLVPLGTEFFTNSDDEPEAEAEEQDLPERESTTEGIINGSLLTSYFVVSRTGPAGASEDVTRYPTPMGAFGAVGEAERQGGTAQVYGGVAMNITPTYSLAASVLEAAAAEQMGFDPDPSELQDGADGADVDGDDEDEAAG